MVDDKDGLNKKISKYKKNVLLAIFFILAGLSYEMLTFAKTPTQALPASLPAVDDPSVSLPESNTPEYVIIRPSEQATFSSESVAEVASIPVKEGSQFKAGDILLEFDCRLPQAELKKSIAQQKAAKMADESAKKLKTYGSISDFELVKASTDRDMADAEVDKLKVAVEKCVIKAPFSGSVTDMLVHEHESAKPGDPLLKIVNTENLEFEMQVPSCWLKWLRIGSGFQVQVNEINKSIVAKVTKINPQIEPVSQSIKLIATITPSNPELLPGMSGQVIFPENPDTKCSIASTTNVKRG